MLTPEQLEAAARKLCKIRGIDPDERRENETRHDEFISTTVVFLAWEECADEIRSYLEIQEAIQSILQKLPQTASRTNSALLSEITTTIDQSQSFNRCLDCGHEWRYHEIHKGFCVGSVDYCYCRNKQPRI